MANDADAAQEVSALVSQVYALVRACPAGRVTTYGWIAIQLRFFSWTY